MRGKKRPQTERARAVGIAVLEGAGEASRKTGIPERTIQEWTTRPEFAELRARTKDQVAEEWWAGVQHGFRRVIEAFDEEADVQKKATAAAILFDKIALLRGDVTSRSEVSTFHGYNDHEKRAIADLLRQALAGDGTADPAAPDAAGAGVEAPSPTGATSPTG